MPRPGKALRVGYVGLSMYGGGEKKVTLSPFLGYNSISISRMIRSGCTSPKVPPLMKHIPHALLLSIVFLCFGCVMDPIQQTPRSAHVAKPVILATCPFCGAKNNVTGIRPEQSAQCGNCGKVFNAPVLASRGSIEDTVQPDTPVESGAQDEKTQAEEDSETTRPSTERVDIGEWYDGRPGVGMNIVFYTLNGKTYTAIKSDGKESSGSEIIKNRFFSGRKYEPKNGSPTGDFFIIDNHGDLQMWDDLGHIYTAPKVK